MQASPALVKGRKELKFRAPINVGVEVKDSKVTNILPCSELLGVIFVGDTIVAVNGTPTVNTEEFEKAANLKLPGSVVIEYLRDEMCTYELKPLTPRKTGYELFEITLTWRSGGTPIGLLIHRDFSGRVIIAMVESGCTASKVVKAGDILLKVNSTEVKDRDVARKMIMESINAMKRVSLTLERCSFAPLPPPLLKPGATPIASASQPENASVPSPPVKAAVIKSMILGPPANTKLDVLLPADVTAILEANKNFFLVKCALPPCLKKTKDPGEATSHLSMLPSNDEAVIPYDPSPKPLKITPKRLGS